MGLGKPFAETSEVWWNVVSFSRRNINVAAATGGQQPTFNLTRETTMENGCHQNVARSSLNVKRLLGEARGISKYAVSYFVRPAYALDQRG